MTALWEQKRDERQRIGELAEALQAGQSRKEVVASLGNMAYFAAGLMGKKERQQWLESLETKVSKAAARKNGAE